MIPSAGTTTIAGNLSKHSRCISQQPFQSYRQPRTFEEYKKHKQKQPQIQRDNYYNQQIQHQLCSPLVSPPHSQLSSPVLHQMNQTSLQAANSIGSSHQQSVSPKQSTIHKNIKRSAIIMSKITASRQEFAKDWKTIKSPTTTATNKTMHSSQLSTNPTSNASLAAPLIGNQSQAQYSQNLSLIAGSPNYRTNSFNPNDRSISKISNRSRHKRDCNSSTSPCPSGDQSTSKPDQQLSTIKKKQNVEQQIFIHNAILEAINNQYEQKKYVQETKNKFILTTLKDHNNKMSDKTQGSITKSSFGDKENSKISPGISVFQKKSSLSTHRQAQANQENVFQQACNEEIKKQDGQSIHKLINKRQDYLDNNYQGINVTGNNNNSCLNLANNTMPNNNNYYKSQHSERTGLIATLLSESSFNNLSSQVVKKQREYQSQESGKSRGCQQRQQNQQPQQFQQLSSLQQFTDIDRDSNLKTESNNDKLFKVSLRNNSGSPRLSQPRRNSQLSIVATALQQEEQEKNTINNHQVIYAPVGMIGQLSLHQQNQQQQQYRQQLQIQQQYQHQQQIQQQQQYQVSQYYPLQYEQQQQFTNNHSNNLENNFNYSAVQDNTNQQYNRSSSNDQYSKSRGFQLNPFGHSNNYPYLEDDYSRLQLHPLQYQKDTYLSSGNRHIDSSGSTPLVSKIPLSIQPNHMQSTNSPKDISNTSISIPNEISGFPSDSYRSATLVQAQQLQQQQQYPMYLGQFKAQTNNINHNNDTSYNHQNLNQTNNNNYNNTPFESLSLISTIHPEQQSLISDF